MTYGMVTVKSHKIHFCVLSDSSHGCVVSIEVQDFYIEVENEATESKMWREQEKNRPKTAQGSEG